MGRHAVLVLAGALLVVLAAPAAAAAEATVTLEGETSFDADPGQTLDREIAVVYEYSGSGTTGGEVTVDLEVEGDDPTTATVSPNPLTIDVDDSRKKGTGTVTLQIQVADDAEAYATPDVTLRAKARSSGTVEASEWSSITANPRIVFEPDLRLRIVDDPVSVRPGSITSFKVAVDNQANGPVRYFLQNTTTPDGLGFSPPPALEISRNDETTPTIRAYQEGSRSGNGTLEIVALYHHASRSRLDHRTDPITVEVRFGGEDGGLLTPTVGAGAAIAAVAAGGAILWWRKRR